MLLGSARNDITVKSFCFPDGGSRLQILYGSWSTLSVRVYFNLQKNYTYFVFPGKTAAQSTNSKLNGKSLDWNFPPSKSALKFAVLND